jgi:endoglucanase
MTAGKMLVLCEIILVTQMFTGCSSKPYPISASPEPPVSAAVELARRMGNGINLGNTMEAYGRVKFGTKGSISDYETFWGQPVTTPQIVGAFKKAGFDTLRIPVAWTNTMAFETGDFKINEAYLTRVGELIEYAMAENMFVIVNDHWDGGWWGMFGSSDENTRKKAFELYVSMWTQIAEKYKDYPNRVIFESANEELGNRLNDTDITPDSGSLSEDECYTMVNMINQVFVDTIRKTGGRNADRFLLIAGYNTDIGKTCDERFVMPTDSAKGRLLVSVHYYEPSDYCINTSVSHWGTKDEYAKMNARFKKMTKFTKAGYGVVVGEYGVSLKKDGSLKDNTLDYIGNLLDNCDVYGYCPVLWDCSSLFKRSTLSTINEAVATMFASRSLSARKGRSVEDIETSARVSLGSSLANAVNPPSVPADVAVAWIMYNSGDFNVSYSVGDTYAPTSKSDGVVATDVLVAGPGIYTVMLDFSNTSVGYAESVGFSAVGIANGERLFPGYIIDIKEILINGQPYTMSGSPYTTSDDGICTRVNLYNAWVTKIPTGVRVAGGSEKKPISACVLKKEELGKVKTLAVTFEYRPK